MKKSKCSFVSATVVCFALCLPVMLSVGCQSTNELPTETHVDLDSFMGTWYVVAYTPILVDGDAHNATEHYALEKDGRIATTYQFRKGAFDGPLKTIRPTGFVRNAETNAEWGMQFIWPFKASYLIIHYDEEMGETIVAHPNRKYAWVMLRKPCFEAETYDRLLQMLIGEGFDSEKIKRLPHNWANDSLDR